MSSSLVRSRAVVMADVARLAGVSQQTVSRVLNDSPHVRDDTRARVMEAVRKLEYRPNRVARALVTGRTRTLGGVSFDTTLHGPASTLLGIDRAAHDAGYFVSIASIGSLDSSSVGGAIERLREQAVDGILVIAPQESAAQALRHLRADVPVVATEAGADDGVPLVAGDPGGGPRAARQHLLALGHRTVSHVSGPLDWYEARDRIDGWRGTLDAAGAPQPSALARGWRARSGFAPRRSVRAGDWSARSGYELGLKLAREPAVTAVFAGNDQMALGVVRALHELGLRLPADISVVGFDDIPGAAFFTPPLTTVRQNFNEVGRRALLTLLDQLESGERAGTRETIPPELIVRASTSAAARA